MQRLVKSPEDCTGGCGKRYKRYKAPGCLSAVNPVPSPEERRAMNTVLPLFAGILSLVFAGFLLARFAGRKGAHLLFWTFGMLLYAVGGLCEAYNGAFGWSPIAFRLWYLCGAFLAAAWLGQGTLAFLGRRAWWVAALTGLLALGSAYAAIRVFTAQLDPALVAAGAPLTGRVIRGTGVRTLTPFFNVYGTLALVGGAAWSAVRFARTRLLPHRVLGNVLIAIGALLPALGGSFSRLGVETILYASELLGAILMFIGFLVSTRSAPGDAASGGGPQRPRPSSPPPGT